MSPYTCAKIAAHNTPLIDEAITQLSRAVDLKPHDTDAMIYLNLVYRRRADFDCANPTACSRDLALANDWSAKSQAARKAAPPPPTQQSDFSGTRRVSAMFVRMRTAFALLLATLAAASALAQSPAAQYEAAHKNYLAHVQQYDFLHDDSPAAISDLQEMWNAIAAYIFDLRKHDPTISMNALNRKLCLLTAEPMPPEAIPQTPEQQCPITSASAQLLELGKGLLLVAPFTGETGTVFVLGERNGKPAILWSITQASAPPLLDPHDLVRAWKPDRAGSKCRDKGSPHKPGACGPLYAALVLLSTDAQNHPRFAIDAGYAQGMGATIGKQATVWEWETDHASLLWDEWYDAMLDQPGAAFDSENGTLVITEKGEFRSLYDCGSCALRPLLHTLTLTRTGVTDLGIRSLTPELDLIDQLLWRIAHKQSTIAIASEQVNTLLQPQIAIAKEESQKIQPTWFSVGMLESAQVRLTPSGAAVCLEADGLNSPINFTLRRTIDGGYRITHAAQPPGLQCPVPYYGRLPSTP